jgi:hypothetical protein
VIWRKKAYRSKTAERFIAMLKEARAESQRTPASSGAKRTEKRR